MDSLRVVLLGKTGSGKSSLGNALLGNKDEEMRFKIGRGLRSETLTCAWQTGTRDGTTIEVIDTPGLCDTHLPSETIYKEVAKSVAVAEPGPHVIILTLRCDRRFTRDEFEAYQTLKKVFSDKIVNHMILVFNGLDVYDDEDDIVCQRMALAKEIGDFGNELKTLLEDANGRYFGMNNKAPPDEREQQVRDLIKMMKDLVRSNRNQHLETTMTREIKRTVDSLINQYVERQGLTESQAEAAVKRDIASEHVEFKVLQHMIQTTTALAAKTVSACCVM